jgi:Tol biopolymer transport system component
MDLSGTRSAIYVQLKGDIQAHSVVSDLGQYSSPAWSPDGKLLAFLHFQPDTAEIVIFDVQRKSSRILTRLFPHRYGLNYRHLDWSPDGKFLVVDDKSQDSEAFSLYLIYFENGRRVRLTYPDSDIIGDVSPRVSPDGTRVAFIRDTYLFEQDLYIASVRGRTYQRLTSAATPISDVGWKTNNVLTFAANHGDGFKFWQFDLIKLGQKEIAASAVDSDRPLQFSVAQNGRLVTFSNYNPNLDIWSIDLTKANNPWVPVIQALGENIRPSVSPDGTRLAFLSNVSGEFQIWISQTDGSNASPVPTGALVPASFCWSSDGNSIIFSPLHVHGLFEVSVHSGPVRQISSIYTDPYYAIDNKSLFVRAHSFIYRIPRFGGSAQEVTEQGGAPIAQSRDGRYLYFSQGRMSTSVARLDLQTGHQEELTSSLLPGYSDAWALSSRGIFFLGQERSGPAIRFFDLATDKDEYIADFPGNLPQVEMSGFGISPDGKHLWVVRADPMPSDIETTMLRTN